MQTNVKIAGTTFHPLPEGKFLKVGRTYTFEDVPCADTDAVLIPEPDNQYDPNAVKVVVPLDSGEAFHVGYIPKDHPLKMMVKNAGRPVKASVMVKNYAMKNQQYSASWIITGVFNL